MNEIDQYYNGILLISSRGVTIASILLLIYAFLKWKKFNTTLKIYGLFLLASFIFLLLEQIFFWSVNTYTETWRPILKAFNIKNTNFLRYPYQVNNFSLLSLFLYRTLKPRPVAVWIKYASILLLAAITINYFFIQGHNMAGGINSLLSALFCVMVPLVSMWYLYNSSSNVPLAHNPYFWINLGLIIPSLISLFLYFAGNDMFDERFTLYAQLTTAKNGIEIFAQILTAIGFYYARNAKYIDYYSLQ